MGRRNTTINVSNWQYNFLQKEPAKCIQARNIIHTFLEELRKIKWETVDFDVNGNTLFTTYLSKKDHEFMTRLKTKKIFFSLSEIARIAFWEYYRKGLFESNVREIKPNYLEANGIKILRRLETPPIEKKLYY